MRCALVALDLGNSLAGITRAMSGQARAAASLGAPLDVIVVNPAQNGVVDGVRYVRYAAIPGLLERPSRFFKARLLASARELDGYDVIFLRYPTAIDLDPLFFIRRTNARVATIHHAKESVETLSAGHTPGLLARAAIETVQGRRILRKIDGIIGVTDEIRDYQVERAGRSVPALTLANGVDVGAIAPTGFVPFDGSTLRLAFLASSVAVWHGTERLLRSLRSYKGSRKVVLDMIGQGAGAPGTEESLGPSVTVRHHGMLKGTALDDVLAKSTLGISTLSFFRTGLKQAAVLKTREYLARGLPTVLGYDDVDIAPGCAFTLQVPNDDSPLAIDEFFAFAERVSAQRNLSREMRAFAESTLDWRVKVPKLVGFGRELRDGARA